MADLAKLCSGSKPSPTFMVGVPALCEAKCYLKMFKNDSVWFCYVKQMQYIDLTFKINLLGKFYRCCIHFVGNLKINVFKDPLEIKRT